MSRILSVAADRAGLAPAARATRLIFLVSGIAMASWAPMVPYAKTRLGLDDASLGLILLAFGGGSMLAMPLVGWLAQRCGNRRVIGVGGLLLCAALPLLALAATGETLAIILFCFGMALGAVDVAMNAHAVAVERRAGRPMMSGFHGLFSIGGLGGALGMSALLALGLPLFGAAVLVATLLVVVVLLLWPGLLDEVNERPAGKRFAMPHRVVLVLGALCFISLLAEGAMLDWSAVFLREFRGFDAAVAGIGYAGFSVAMALVRLVGDRVVSRIGSVLTVRLGAGVAAAGFLLAALVAWPPAALIGFVLVGFGAANIVPVMFGAAGRLPGASPEISLATVTMLGYAGLLSGPALIGFLAQASNLPTALAAVAGLLLATAASARWVRA